MESFKLIKTHPIIEGILDDWCKVVGDDYERYRNHVYRVFNYCMAFHNYQKADETNIAVAACFHDIALWSKCAFDYLELSIEEMEEYIASHGSSIDMDVVTHMIRYHHKFFPYKGKYKQIVENFRRADTIDITKGRIRFGCSKYTIQLVAETFPYLSFHRMLKQMTIKNFFKNPFKPLPMFKW